MSVLPKCRRLALRSEILAARERVMRVAREIATRADGEFGLLQVEIRDALVHLDKLEHEMRNLGGSI